MGHKFSILLYYKFHQVKNPEALMELHRGFCEDHGIKGRILINEKGMNGTCAGLQEDIDAFKLFVRNLPGFEDMWFKEHSTDHIPFRKMIVRVRNEIVALGVEGVEPGVEGGHITPAQLNEMIEHDDVVLFDTRNEIEYEVGHFKGAINPKIEHFRELPKVLDKYSDLKEKKIVMYCTGGIRCEKIARHFKDEGFKNVYQLEGGIYNYCQQFPDKHWVGDCFVFDDRMAIRFTKDGVVNAEDVPKEKIISHCKFCKEKSNRIVNNEAKDGRELVVCCKSCDEKLDISRVRKKGEGYRA